MCLLFGYDSISNFAGHALEGSGQDHTLDCQAKRRRPTIGDLGWQLAKSDLVSTGLPWAAGVRIALGGEYNPLPEGPCAAAAAEVANEMIHILNIHYPVFDSINST